MNGFTPVTVNRNSTLDDRKFALTQIYRQVLERQPYESERHTIAALEKDFLSGKLGVRRFLKDFCCSDLYLDNFYYRVSNTKFMDVCFKHLLGRAIIDREEMHLYNDILIKEGVRHLMNAILDSEEYRKAFGCFTVPHPREQHYYNSPEAFLESKLLNEEHFGQRGWVVPTIYWRQLGLDCSNGVCRHPEADEVLPEPSGAAKDMSVDALLKLLKTSDVRKAKELIAGLSPKQRESLRLALH